MHNKGGKKTPSHLVRFVDLICFPSSMVTGQVTWWFVDSGCSHRRNIAVVLGRIGLKKRAT
jgi:hypothetical protein